MPVKKPVKPVAKKKQQPVVPASEEVITGEIVPTSGREAPIERVLNKKDVIQPVFNDAQLSILLNRTPKWAIKVRQGRGNNYKYVPHGYVTDTLNKAFGFNWDLVIDPIEGGKMFSLQIIDYDEKTGNKLIVPKRYVAVAGHIIVRVMDTDGAVVYEVTKYGFGSQEWLSGMEFGDALKAARSDLVKTCAFQLGIALDLYWNERAEFEEFEAKVEKRNARLLLEKGQSVSDVPTQPIHLLAKAFEQYKLDGDAIAKLLKLSDIGEIMMMNEQQTQEAWEKIKLKGNNKK